MSGEQNRQNKKEPGAQRQEMAIGTLALLFGLFRLAFEVSRALVPKGNEALKNTGGICIYVFTKRL